jgi:hypothetical protein
MLKELVKLANHLDQKGLAKEADYLDNIIKKMANIENPDYYLAEPENEEFNKGNPGSMFEHQEDLRDERDKDEFVRELQKTYDWFERVVFPAIEYNKWPIVTDDKYYIGRIGKARNLKNLEFMPKGLEWKNTLHENTWMSSFGEMGEMNMSLRGVYDFLEKTVLRDNLPVTMQSANPLK